MSRETCTRQVAHKGFFNGEKNSKSLWVMEIEGVEILRASHYFMARLVLRFEKKSIFFVTLSFSDQKMWRHQKGSFASLKMTSHYWQTTFFLGVQCLLSAMAIPLGKYVREINNLQQNEIPPTTTSSMSTITSSSNVTLRTSEKTMTMAGITFKQPH